MNKSIITLAACVACASAFAAFDTTKLAAHDVLAPTQITANATNESSFVLAGYKGNCEVILAATPADGRTIDATLYGRNSTSETWTVISTITSTSTNSVAIRLPFVGEYVKSSLKLAITPAATTTVSAVIIGNK